jgi:hypothetical protein
MKINIILIYIVALLILVASCPKAYSVEYKPFIGKSITYYNTDSPQINKNEHLGRLKDHLKGGHVGLSIFEDNSFISCSSNRLFQQPTEIRFLSGKVERKTLIDSCSLGNSISTKVGNFSASIVLSSVNVYDKFNGITTSTSALIKGLSGGIFKDKNYYGVYWFDHDKELGFKNAFGIVYNRYF